MMMMTMISVCSLSLSLLSLSSCRPQGLRGCLCTLKGTKGSSHGTQTETRTITNALTQLNFASGNSRGGETITQRPARQSNNGRGGLGRCRVVDGGQCRQPGNGGHGLLGAERGKGN
ncbi:hypothetical protein DFP73DRAFT_367343 [Morchella snyderi]|nr:hypothetical protein DFP73DRAFT_367343 [Morchella snyderi]